MIVTYNTTPAVPGEKHAALIQKLYHVELVVIVSDVRLVQHTIVVLKNLNNIC